MNYRHIYHAGNFADVIKHLTLIAILNNLRKKDKPFVVLDAFAGLGIYDLTSEQTSKAQENSNGIRLILGAKNDQSPALLQQFISIVKLAGEDYYPGSPWIISSLLRPGDRLIACELHPEDYASLKYLFRKDKQVAVHLQDAYRAVKAFLPFKENRGLILLDPPFEIKNEFDRLVESLKIIKLRAAGNCCTVWYPIKDKKLAERFYQNCQSIGFKEMLIIEFELSARADQGMSKCGLLIANPPLIYDEINSLLVYLKEEVYKGTAEFTVKI